MKRDQDKTKGQLVKKLTELRRRVAEKEESETEREEVAEGPRETNETILQQPQKPLDISIPIMQVLDGVLVVQLNGQDSQIIKQLVELLRERIVEANSSVVVVDMTDIPSIGTEMAQHLTGIISTARLLSNQVVLVGVRTPVSQLLAHLGVDLSCIKACPSLVVGLWAALDMLESVSTEIR